MESAVKKKEAVAGTGRVSFLQVRDALIPVEDPEIHMGIVELGLIYGAKIEPAADGKGDAVTVQASLTSPACPYGPMLLAQIHASLARIPGVTDVNVDLVFSPQWDPRTMASEEAKEHLGIF